MLTNDFSDNALKLHQNHYIGSDTHFNDGTEVIEAAQERQQAPTCHSNTHVNSKWMSAQTDCA